MIPTLPAIERGRLLAKHFGNARDAIPDVTTKHREQRVRIVVGKLMSHHGYAQTNPDQDVLKLRSPRARAWISLANAIVDALFPGKEG
ncbi:hypothetical protein [Burkholderia cenocepacia]|uniref:hypothetical protein n=1 Tax=Burkholderia cenocepacia TaxID=95486 RepID=UPI0015E7FBB8|nr:hypothetical protein [Burkholderia cenocepacia]